MRVEVVYALAHRQHVAEVEVGQGTTLRGAIERSGLLALHPDIDLARNRIGVFGQLRNLDDAAADGDRIEIYRPLPADPREQRRRRALTSPSCRRG